MSRVEAINPSIHAGLGLNETPVRKFSLRTSYVCESDDVVRQIQKSYFCNRKSKEIHVIEWKVSISVLATRIELVSWNLFSCLLLTI